MAIVGFLAIPKTAKKYAEDLHFRKFKKQLLHSSLSKILSSLKPAILGPYIADYPEQSALACVVYNWCAKCFAFSNNLDGLNKFDYGMLWEEWGIISDLVPFTNDFPCADIHELLLPDILHQIIKGTFKDHLVAWVELYLLKEHGKTCAKGILDDIDCQIAAAPSFAGLRRFPEGHGFSQWTSDDLKALMKVYLPAIKGHVPQDIVRCFHAFLGFCYIVRQDIITEDTLEKLSDALQCFHQYWKIFQDTGSAEQFVLVNNRIKTHQGRQGTLRLDKIAASRMDFTARKMLNSSIVENLLSASSNTQDVTSIAHNGDNTAQNTNANANANTNNTDDENDNENDDDSAVQNNNEGVERNPMVEQDEIGDGVLEGPRAQSDVKMARTPHKFSFMFSHSIEMDIPDLPRLLRLFLYDQLVADGSLTSDDVPLSACPRFEGPIKVFNSAAATFFAPSDPSGIGGMHRAHIRAALSWRRGPPHLDTVFINTASEDSINGMEVERVLCFFSFCHSGEIFPCTLIHWFKLLGDKPDLNVGMWTVRPSFHEDGSRELSIIHLDTIIRTSHLLPIFGDDFIEDDVTFHNSLDLFKGYYVNKFVDHNSFEIAS
ncbi:uncharacterized protein BJ212DRAFT_1572872 [Suillus subaureus]|uniref:Uncharacterized protein n=1 Tax=Suillus subaureus TaxID=48587 RepID=A0A9P7EQP2_9AGAM|nr:uncharacterized protein BJ212DRAFT_1572872 [Suillus subaureus]KAG1827500.1 hypothetical protein BJ212DRAFT_1572872 [Suillus subaureus]